VDKERVVRQFQQRVQAFLSHNDEWRAESERMRDIFNGYPAYKQGGDNYQWKKLNDGTRVKRMAVEPVKISLAPAYCRAVCGSLLRDRKRVAAVNMSSTTALSADADVMDDMFQALEEVTQVESVKYRMVTEAAITGVGGSVFYLDMTVKQAPFGVAMEEDKQYIFFDKGRNGRLDSDEIAWCGYADPVYRDDLAEYVERNNELDIDATCDFSGELLNHVESSDQSEIDFIYHYFWREWTQLTDVRNAFRDNKEFFLELAAKNEVIDKVIEDVVKDLNLNIEEEYFSFAKEEFAVFKKALDNVWYLSNMDAIRGYNELASFHGLEVPASGVNQSNFNDLLDSALQATGYAREDLPSVVDIPTFETTKREGRAYYKAEFAAGKMLKCERSFTSQCHAMNFVTAFWDSRAGHHYGLMRHLAFPQKELEKALTSMQSYSENAASGGNVGLRGAADKTKLIKDYMDTKAKTIPLGDTEIVSYGSPDAAQSHQQAVQMFLQLMPKVLGVSDAIFAEVMSGNMTSALFKQLKEQISLANAEFAYAIDRSDIIRGYIYRDIVHDMASMIKGEGAIPIKYYIGDRENLVMLSKKSLSRYYGVRLVARPSSMDEKKEMAQMLIDVFPQQASGAIAPIVFDLLPLDQQVKDSAAKIMNPQPPSPEEQQAMLMKQQLEMAQMQANVRMMNAQALQLEQQSGREQSASALNQQKSVVEIDKAAADIEHKQAQTMKAEADAAAVIANIGMQAYQQVDNMGNGGES
jgi:hypothetical protein